MIGFLASLILFSGAASAAPATVRSFFKVVQTQGLTAPDWRLLKKAPLALQHGDRVRTGAASWAELRLEDAAKVRLEANADFELPDVGAGTTEVRLAAGTVSAWVQKRANREFRVRTPNATCSVRGTYFRVSVAGGVTTVELYEGLVAVTDNQGHELLLEPNQAVEVGDALGVPFEVVQDKADKNDRTDVKQTRGDDAVTMAKPGDQDVAGTAEWMAENDDLLNDLLRELDLDYRKEQVNTQDIQYSQTEQQRLGAASIDASGSRSRSESFLTSEGNIATIYQNGGLIEGELRDAVSDNTPPPSDGGGSGSGGETGGGDSDRGHGNDEDHFDEDNPGQGHGNDAIPGGGNNGQGRGGNDN